MDESNAAESLTAGSVRASVRDSVRGSVRGSVLGTVNGDGERLNAHLRF